MSLVALCIALEPALDAGVVRYVQRNADTNLSASLGPTALPLNDSGATAFTFPSGPGSKLVAITFSAECAIGGGPGNWLNIRVMVDDKAVPPSGGDDAFCSGNGTATHEDGWVTASRTVAVRLGPGQHEVQVFVTLVGSASAGWIGDSSLTIFR
jgi:hypothetical protein